jgi:CHAT domain-containing protein
MKLKRGEIGSALEETDQACRRYSSEKTEWHWRFRVLKAEILERQGLGSESLKLLEPEPPPSLARSDLAVRRKLAQGVASAFSQQFTEASRFVAEAESLARADHPDLLGEVALAKATVYFLAGETKDAEIAYRLTLQIARQQKDPFLEASALGGMGVVATKNEHYDEAIDWNLAALQLAQTVSAQSGRARILGNTGWSYLELGDFENALTFFTQAEEESARRGFISDRIYWLAGIAEAYYGQRDYASAEATLKEALDLARSQGDKGTLTLYLNDLSEIELESGRTDLAERYYKEASDIEQAGLDQSGVLDSRLVRGRIAASKNNYAEAERSFQLLIHDPRADAPQRWEAEARLAEVYADQKLSTKAENEFRLSLETIESARSSVQTEDLRLSFLSSAMSFYNDYIEFLIARHRIEDALQVAEVSRARTLAEGLGAAPRELSFPMRNFHPEQVAWRANATLLFYSLGVKHSYLWVITKVKVSCLPLAPATEIDQIVRAYQDAVLKGRDVLESSNPYGEKLYAMLVNPAKELIPNGARVIVLPDGSLYGLNFETLLVSDAKLHFWIEDVTLTTASSLTLLASSRNRTYPANGNLLLVGNATPATKDFPVLRQAETEMARIERYFPESRREILAGPKATPTAFLSSKPERFAYLHFVTHGTASRTHPLDSAVILSPEADSFKLYARDVVKHPLSAYLVTVSACNGSGTRTYSGEGLVGLSWAFLRAGAHNVIGALWEVSDSSTPQLMDRLYGELSAGHDPADALRLAKLSLLKSDGVYKKPFYWAPFQLYVGS